MTDYKSPQVSCIICKKVTSSKGIHSHFIGAHGTEEEKKNFTGKGGHREQNFSTAKQKAKDKRSVYYENPKLCSLCNSPHKYESRNNKFCSPSCRAKHGNEIRDKVVYEKLSNTLKSLKLEPVNKHGAKCNIFQCKICLNFFPGKTRNRKICDNKDCRYENLRGKVGGYRPNSSKRTQCIYKGIKLDSGAEKRFANLLDTHNIKWLKNTTIKFEYTDQTGKKRNYYPDFYLPEHDLWVEIKGKYYYDEQNDPIKWKTLQTVHKKSLEIIWSSDIKLPAVCTSNDLVLST